MRKKIYVLAAAAAMTGILLTACTPKTNEGTQTTAPTETTAASDTTASGDTTAADDTTAAGDATAGDNTENVSADEKLNKAHQAVKKAYGDNYIPSMPYDAAALKEVFGIDESLYDAVIAEGPMISVHVETFIGIKAVEGKAKEVAAALESYRTAQLENAMQYPMNMVKLEAAQVVAHGDYVFFVMLGSADEEAEMESESAALESAKKNNQIAVDAIDEVFKAS